MCTVTFIPGHQTCFLTSNRDEKIVRGLALPPRLYTHDQRVLLYPKDADAGGTWIGMQDNGTAAVLLNGGFVKHSPMPPYTKSRGLVMLDVLTESDPLHTLLEYPLSGVEPFTIVLLQKGKLFEIRWDGTKIWHTALDERKPHIWSSVTLYDAAMIRKRENWFLEWLKENPSPDQSTILHFHQFTGEGNRHIDLCMNRDNRLLTVSITSMEIKASGGRMQYQDLRSDRVYTTDMKYFTEQAVS
jgi:hypothetical protein